MGIHAADEHQSAEAIYSLLILSCNLRATTDWVGRSTRHVMQHSSTADIMASRMPPTAHYPQENENKKETDLDILLLHVLCGTRGNPLPYAGRGAAALLRPEPTWAPSRWVSVRRPKQVLEVLSVHSVCLRHMARVCALDGHGWGMRKLASQPCVSDH